MSPPPLTPSPARAPASPSWSAGEPNASSERNTLLESRRFRTWEGETGIVAARAWVILLRYGLQRMVRTWYLSVALAVTAIYIVVVLGVFTYAGQSGYTKGDLDAAIAMFLLPGAIYLFLVGTPLIAEDVRYNAPLFYFSRPLRVRHYFLGKGVQLAGVIALTSLLPIILFALMIPIVGLKDAPPTDWYGQAWEPRNLHDWKVSHLDTIGDWLYGSFVMIVGAISVLFFVVSTMIACSAHTRRAWHAGMAFVAILGSWTMLGVFATELVKGAAQNLFGPGGWVYLVLEMPLALQFSPYARPYSGSPSSTYDGAGFAIVLAHLLLLGVGAFALWLSDRRLSRLEALL